MNKLEQECFNNSEDSALADKSENGNDDARGFFGRMQDKISFAAKTLAVLSVLSPMSSLAKSEQIDLKPKTNKEVVEKREVLSENSFFRIEESLTGEKNEGKDLEVASKIKRVYISAVCGGEKEKKGISLSAEELEKSPVIKVKDGYVVGAIFLCDEDVDVSVNGGKVENLKMIKRLEYSNGDNFIASGAVEVNGDIGGINILDESGSIIDDNFREDDYDKYFGERKLDLEKKHKGIYPIKGAYFFGSVGVQEGLYSNISDSSENILKFSDGNGEYKIRLEQDAEDVDVPSAKKAGIGITYLGAGADDFKRNEHLMGKLDSVTARMSAIEKMFGDKNLVDEIILYNINFSNAFTLSRKIIGYTIKGLDSLGVENVVEHETLHRHFLNSGLTSDPDFIRYFGDLRGGDLSRADLFYADKGGNPSGKEIKNINFFRFIKEENYLNAVGGHPGDNPDEFAVSFTNSLIHIDRMNNELQEATSSQDSTMAIQKRDDILGAYESSLAAMIKFSKTEKEKEFFNHYVEIFKKIKEDKLKEAR